MNSKQHTSYFKELSKWMNAINDAYCEGRAPWAFIDNISVAVSFWNQNCQISGEDAALKAIINLAISYGIKLK